MEPLTPSSASSNVSSLGTGTGSTFTAVAAPQEVATAKELIGTMKSALGSLGATFDTLHNQTTQIAVLGGELQTAKEINDLRSQMQSQDVRQKNGIEEIELLLKQLLQNHIVEHLKQQVEQEIVAKVDELVNKQVAQCLESHIPQELQNQVAEQKRLLQDVQRALHNSESRRANALLRSDDQDNSLDTIYMSNGEVSMHYPKNLNALFNLDVDTSKRLMQDYEIADVSDSKDRNLNRFMQFCGVFYQVVRTGAKTRRVGTARQVN